VEVWVGKRVCREKEETKGRAQEQERAAVSPGEQRHRKERERRESHK